MKKKYVIEADDREVVEMTDRDYGRLVRDAAAVLETPEEYGDFVFIARNARTEDGHRVFLGFR